MVMASFSSAGPEFSGKSASEVSNILYNRIVPWSNIQSAGVFLSRANEVLIEKAQSHLESFLLIPEDAMELVRLYYTLANNCTYDLQVQQYVFTRFEEILVLGTLTSSSGSNGSSVSKESNGSGNRKGFAHLFVTKDGELNDGAFIRALTNSDPYLQLCAARGLATIYANVAEELVPVPAGDTGSINISLSPDSKGQSGPALDSNGRVSNLSNLVYWMKNNLMNSIQDTTKLEIVTPAMMNLVHCAAARPLLLGANAVGILTNIISCLNVTGNPQSLYEICFVLWTLSLPISSSDGGSHKGSSSIAMFSQAGTVRWLVELLTAAPTRKISRMTVACLLNLAKSEDRNILAEIFSTSLPRLVDTMIESKSYRAHKDAEYEADVKALAAVLEKNYRELSTFERWSAEVTSGALRWGVVHSEKFWKENHRFMEADDWGMLVKLIACLDKTADAETVCVALFDLGEFTRVYPNGRVITSRLGGKDKALKLVQSENEDVQNSALQSVSKIMIGWDATNA